MLRGYSLFLACWTFLLVIAGGTVVSTGSGSLLLDHQAMAGVAGTLTLILAVLFWRAPIEPVFKRAGWIGVGLVLAQGVLGLCTALLRLPTAIAIAHACLGQIFFAWIASIVWIAYTPGYEASSELTPPAQKMYRIAATTTGFILLQLLAGAVYRHTGRFLHFHFLGAFLVVLHGLLLLRRAWASPGLPAILRRLASVLNVLIAGQLVLGFLSWRMPFPEITTAHQSVGALILAAAVIITLQSTRRGIAG